MIIAGEASGDLLAAELVSALRAQSPDAKIFGAGGAKMSAAGVELAFDMTQHAVVGIADVLKNYLKFQRLFNQLRSLAIERKPDAIIGVDFGGFNLRFGRAIKELTRYDYSEWNPKIIQFVSPQVWASRPHRADLLAADYDLLLSIFPFEKNWYAQRVPNFKVEFVGNPMVERFISEGGVPRRPNFQSGSCGARPSEILLLPGSRKSELKKHLPIILPALKLIQEKLPDAKPKIVLPDESLVQLAKSLGADCEIQIGNLPDALAQADIAIASTGTVTMECAFFGVPTVTIYRAPLLDLGLKLGFITAKWFTMPNLLANEEVYPEFLGSAATPENISRATLELLQDELRRQKIKSQLEKIIASLGEPGAANRAASAILSLF